MTPIDAYHALNAANVELHMVTRHGPKVGEPLDQISFEHIVRAEALLESLIKSQPQYPVSL